VIWELMVGMRYLRSRRRHVPLSLISAISLAGVTIGVATLLIVMGVMTGMERDLATRSSGSTRTSR
jgi:lipoprotein-releasing system permease protein